MGKLNWIIFIVVVVGLFGGLVAWNRIANPAVDISKYDYASIIGASEDNGNIADHTLGDVDSKVVIVEYGDYQCSGCVATHGYVDEFMDDYQDKVVFIFRHFPLSYHTNAKAAIAAAEAANEQGEFWEMHNLLYSNQSTWSSMGTDERTAAFIDMANQLGLDTEKFESDLSNSNYTKKISFDQDLGSEQGVDSTPSFFINGEKVDDDILNSLLQGDLESFKALVDTKLAETE